MLFSAMEWAAAQTPYDAVMMKQRESCAALIYDKGHWNHYWEGSYLRTNGTVATVNRKIVLPMIAIGIHDKVNLIVSVPYVKTYSSEPNGGKFEGAHGFQDLGLVLKSELLNYEVGTSRLIVLSAFGYSTPITNYLSDYRPYSIGFGANEFSARGIVHYKIQHGIYFRVDGGYLWRGQTKAERDYYYNNGSYYTAWMDVPNAWEFQGVAGIRLLNNDLRLEGSYYMLRSVSGDDIRKYNAGQPTNKVEYGQVTFNAQYYLKNVRGVSVMTYYTQVLNGRNWGKFTNLGIGATYQFKI